jgi:FAD/FMN-containing dehydrogenase
MTSSVYVSSWGHVRGGHHSLVTPHSRSDRFPALPPATTALPFGNGRSYGDSCLNSGGVLLQTRRLDRFIHFDASEGVLTCEAGVLLGDILGLIVPRGWFLPVVPGTQHVTVGGAIANDVHGKNHHRAGTFGSHVCSLELLRSSGERLSCSSAENPDWFAATIGGLGLTGLIVSAQLRLRPVVGAWMDVETIRYGDCKEFFTLSEKSDASHEYAVAWIDCLARGSQLGRGLFQRANHASRGDAVVRRGGVPLGVPFTPPLSLVNPVSLRIFNTLHYRRAPPQSLALRHFQSFFFPLDSLRNWNRLYGPRGFYQYQCVLPSVTARDALTELLTRITESGLGSFLAVLKQCGAAVSPGMLSFPRPGVTLALDFPNRSARTAALLERLDEVVDGAGGCLYPAKDARMSAALFQRGYPRWREFSAFIDPCCSSDFWRRVAAQP